MAVHMSQPSEHCLGDVLALRGHMNSQDFLPFTLKTLSGKTPNHCPAAPLHHQALLPPSHWPRGLQGRLYQWVSCYPRASDFPQGGNQAVSIIPPPRSQTAMRTIHTVSASCGPSQPFLYLRKDWEIWCTIVRLRSFS